MARLTEEQIEIIRARLIRSYRMVRNVEIEPLYTAEEAKCAIELALETETVHFMRIISQIVDEHIADILKQAEKKEFVESILPFKKKEFNLQEK